MPENQSNQFQNQLQQLVNQVQLYQQQIQTVLLQKETLNMQIAEIDAALKEMENTKETDIYKISGPILIKAGKADLQKELNEKKEMTSIRVKTLEKNENLIRSKLTELRNKLSKFEKA